MTTTSLKKEVMLMDKLILQMCWWFKTFYLKCGYHYTFTLYVVLLKLLIGWPRK